MDAEGLLRVKPEELSEGLLARWGVLEEQLPGVIRNLEAEEDALSPKVEKAIESHRLANESVSNLKKERNESQERGRTLLTRVREFGDMLSESGGMVNLDPGWKKEKLLEELEGIESQIETSALDHKSEGKLISRRKKLIEENEKWLKERKHANPEMAEYVEARREMVANFRDSERAHTKMLEKVKKAQPLYEKKTSLQEEIRDVRRQLDRAKELLSQSSKAIEYWRRRLRDGFGDIDSGHDDLLADMHRVMSGGASSFSKVSNGDETARGEGE
ncbi:MAG: hypothetical protein CMB53_02575 [Euryarchaeota archaeon]|nr:hypothetical protein [Euryarchaeota archaeon]|tara:strand:+ start:43402 stop:44223 length:822 start_codon:yes stop_codon:yes gene_type:complete